MQQTSLPLDMCKGSEGNRALVYCVCTSDGSQIAVRKQQDVATHALREYLVPG